MTPEQQRIAIAEACGWRVEGPIEGALWNIYHNDRYIAYVIEPDKTVTLGEIDCIPDYLNDLNAMHEVEKTLKKDGTVEYEGGIFGSEVSLYSWILFGSPDGWPAYISAGELSSNTFATAAQRAEAFLRTKGLWKE